MGAGCWICFLCFCTLLDLALYRCNLLFLIAFQIGGQFSLFAGRMSTRTGEHGSSSTTRARQCGVLQRSRESYKNSRLCSRRPIPTTQHTSFPRPTFGLKCYISNNTTTKYCSLSPLFVIVNWDGSGDDISASFLSFLDPSWRLGQTAQPGLAQESLRTNTGGERTNEPTPT